LRLSFKKERAGCKRDLLSFEDSIIVNYTTASTSFYRVFTRYKNSAHVEYELLSFCFGNTQEEAFLSAYNIRFRRLSFLLIQDNQGGNGSEYNYKG
jgi:hypothetical protein